MIYQIFKQLIKEIWVFSNKVGYGYGNSDKKNQAFLLLAITEMYPDLFPVTPVDICTMILVKVDWALNSFSKIFIR